MDDPNARQSTSRAWWSGTIASFRSQSVEEVLGRLASRAIDAHSTNRSEQQQAWRWEIDVLRTAMADIQGEWRLFLEYPLLRLSRVIDAVLVTDRAIIVLEFKALTGRFSESARVQAEDYAFDLRDFHAGSRDHIIIPIVVAGTGRPSRPQWVLPLPGVAAVYETLPGGLPLLLKELLRQIPHRNIDFVNWEHAEYRPVPTIIEAARALYAKHGVAEIRSSGADTTATTFAILQALREAKERKTHVILFVTGVPGAGKTLCGLDAIFSSETDGTFLTGTLPMVYVLKAALALDSARVGRKSIRAAQHETKSKIESITAFLRYYIAEKKHLPEHMIVFDEAQRAWDANYGAKKFQHDDSEAGIVLDIMQRHSDYAVIVALVGNGQEINSGEAGLAEWGKALSVRPIWKIRAAPGVLTAVEPRQRLFPGPQESMLLDERLHLGTAIRNLRSTTAAPWVDALLQGKRDEARRIAGDHLPFFVTRSLAEMRRGLRSLARGERRAGLVCSSGAKRLVADGLWPKFEHMKEDIVANWFLKRWPHDVRASDALEIPATEFACQGLELDYVGLCWGGDMIWNGFWQARNFKGTKWEQIRKEDSRDFQVNTYRVLLTRARAETIIWVPIGDPGDKTRTPEPLDRTADYLLECGARPLPEQTYSVPEEAEASLF